MRLRHYSVFNRIDPEYGPMLGYCKHGQGRHTHGGARRCRDRRNKDSLDPSQPTMRWYVWNERWTY